MGVTFFHSLHSDKYPRMKAFVRRSAFVPFRRFLGDVHRELIMQHLYVVLRSTVGSYVRDASQENSYDAVACLLTPRAFMRVGFNSLSDAFFLIGDFISARVFKINKIKSR
jgi:hypothetical protein